MRLTESVRQDRAKGLTIFDQEDEERRGGTTAVEALLADVPDDLGRGHAPRSSAPASTIDAVLGDYDGGPFDARADVWIILARKR